VSELGGADLGPGQERVRDVTKQQLSSAITAGSAASRLRAKLEPLIAEVSARSQTMAEHPDPRAMYRALLELLYSEVRATVPLLAAAEQRAAQLAAQGDAVAEAMLAWLHEHIADEADHAAWILGDYDQVGGEPDALTLRPGSPTIAALVGSVYYWTLHAHPVAILGYCAVLEGYPPSSAFIDHMIHATGFSQEAFDTLRHHSTIDVEHGGEIFDLVDQLPLGTRHEAVIGMTALQTADLLVVAGDELLSSLMF
jgi:Iron-containing redox enzyme